MSRINRRNWTNTDIGHTPFGDINVFFDNTMKSILRINQEELDNFLADCDDSELELLIEENFSFAQKRKILSMLNNYVAYDDTI